MRKLLISFIVLSILLLGCSFGEEPAQITATTAPVYEFAARLCDETGLTVTRLVTESVSCLHDYTLQVSQMRAIEAADVVVMSGAGLEEFLEGVLEGAGTIIDASTGIELICPEEDHDHDHDHGHEDGHHHDQDPHIWLSPVNAKIMVRNICDGLTAQYPQYTSIFADNLKALLSDLDKLQAYGEEQLSGLACSDLITFHDGFAYFAESFGLHILKAVEEESGSEASAAELIELIGMVEEHRLPAIFTEANGSVSAAQIISAETGAAIYSLDMAISGDSYFNAMYNNINTIKEALG